MMMFNEKLGLWLMLLAIFALQVYSFLRLKEMIKSKQVICLKMRADEKIELISEMLSDLFKEKSKKAI